MIKCIKSIENKNVLRNEDIINFFSHKDQIDAIEFLKSHGAIEKRVPYNFDIKNFFFFSNDEIMQKNFVDFEKNQNSL